MSTFGLAWDDQIHVQFAPLSIPLSNNKFVIRMSSTVGTATTVTSAIEMDYESATGLQNTLIGPNGTLRYPNASTVPNYIRGVNLVDRATMPIIQITRAKPFALLSVRAKTTSGGRDESNMDGRLATKPWCFAHANIGASTQKVVSENAANHSHEIDLQVLDNGTQNLIQTDMQDRDCFISGQTVFME